MKEKAQKYNIGTGFKGWNIELFYAGCPEWSKPLTVSGLNSTSDNSPIQSDWAWSSDKNKIHRHQQFEKVLNILDNICMDKKPNTSELSVRGWVMLVKAASKQTEGLQNKIFKAISTDLKSFKENLNGPDDSNLNFQAGFNKIDIFNAHLVNNPQVPYKYIMECVEEKVEQIELKIEERNEQIDVKELEKNLISEITSKTPYKSHLMEKLNPIIEGINKINALKGNNEIVPILVQNREVNTIDANIFNFALKSEFCDNFLKQIGVGQVLVLKQTEGYKIVGTSNEVNELEQVLQYLISQSNNSGATENTNQVDLKIEEKIETKKTTEPTKIATEHEAKMFILYHEKYFELPEEVRKMAFSESNATYNDIALAVWELDQNLVGVVEFTNFELPN